MSDQGIASTNGRIKWRLLFSLTALIIATLVVAWDLTPYFDYRSKANHIRQLIPIGSNIDDASSILSANGFAFQGKHFATVAENKYWIDVTVASKPRPWTLTILHLMGVKLYFHWVVIESGLDNKVRTVF